MRGKKKKAAAVRNKAAGEQGLEEIQNNKTLKCSCGGTEFCDIIPDAPGALRICLKCDRIILIDD